MSTLNNAIVDIRTVIARAGEADRFAWWPSEIYGRRSTFMKRIFPSTSDRASYRVISHGVRQRDGTLEPTAGLLGLFFLGVERETVLGQVAPEVPDGLLDETFESGAQLAECLLDTYLPEEKTGALERADSMRINEVHDRVDVSEVFNAHLDEEATRELFGSLVAALRFSEPRAFVPPVVRITGR